MRLANEWLEVYESKKRFLGSNTDLDEYFTSSEIMGLNMEVVNIGKIDITSGELLVRDPFVELDMEQKPYLTKVPKGSFDIEVSLAKEIGRCVAVKIAFNDNKALRYEEALTGEEDLKYVEDDESFFGFGVDAGLATIIDKDTLKVFCDFEERFSQEKPEDNLYDEYIDDLFYADESSAGKEFAMWKIPGTDCTMPFISTGFGDGVYPVYFGYDKDDKVCSLYIEFINMQLEFADEE